MSLNFPTAFWKKQPTNESLIESFSISWDTRLAWSRGDGVSEADVNTPLENEVCCACPAPSCETTFPFTVGSELYYGDYDRATWVGDSATIPYYAWFLTGGYDNEGENDLSAYHQANPWTTHSTGIRIDFEADYDTAVIIEDTIAGTRSIEEGYNSFVQSGSATGTFTVSAAQAPATLLVKASGLGEDYETVGGAPYYDAMTVYLDDTLICSGESPADERDVLGLGEYVNYDMQQVKLYAGADLETIVNYQQTPTTNLTKGAPRADSSEAVDQDTRTSYTTSNGIGTFTKTNLSAGEYKIKINASTIDGVFNSGAFYGINFDLT